MLERSPGAGAALREAAVKKAECRMQALAASKCLRRAIATKLDVDIFEVRTPGRPPSAPTAAPAPRTPALLSPPRPLRPLQVPSFPISVAEDLNPQL